ncbi:MAG: rod shape-determining protein MreC [Burkholderiales bacterium]|jgi:rod shape-determining protein MreC|nr:rod shape-determining protein MreC [Burkholderiales bacterium]
MQAAAPLIFRRGPSLGTRFAGYALIALVLLVADARLRYLEQVRAAAAFVLYPLETVARMPAVLGARAADFFVTQAALYRENESLRKERLLATEEVQRLRALERENAQLRRLIGAAPSVARSRTLAEILFETRDAYSRRVAIDRGGAQGVKLGQPVIDHAGVIGQVTRVFAFTAEVSLITDKSQSIPVQDVRSGLRSVTFGTGRDAVVELGFIPINADIQIGDQLVTSGIDGLYPPGLPVAVIENIERNAAFSYARVTCRPLGGVSSWNRVVVLGDGPALPDNTLGGARLVAPPVASPAPEAASAVAPGVAPPPASPGGVTR